MSRCSHSAGEPFPYTDQGTVRRGMDQHKGNIWEWLTENSRSGEEAQDEAWEPGHRIDDETLLALEREAEVMARLEGGGGS
jgi:hypothetical protein